MNDTDDTSRVAKKYIYKKKSLMTSLEQKHAHEQP